MTEFAAAMASFVRQVHPQLRAEGFRKRRHTFNRSTEDGVVQVVNFQMGSKLPPGAEPIPRLRPDLYGLFTVNLGVAVREAWERALGVNGREFPAFLNDYDCQIRCRLGDVLGRSEDVWWSLEEPNETVGDVVVPALMGPALSWLEERASREGILRLWRRGGREALPTPTDLPVVMILRHQDRTDEAAEVFRRYYASRTDHPGHRGYLREVAQSLNIEGLEPH